MWQQANLLSWLPAEVIKCVLGHARNLCAPVSYFFVIVHHHSSPVTTKTKNLIHTVEVNCINCTGSHILPSSIKTNVHFFRDFLSALKWSWDFSSRPLWERCYLFLKGLTGSLLVFIPMLNCRNSTETTAHQYFCTSFHLHHVLTLSPAAGSCFCVFAVCFCVL